MEQLLLVDYKSAAERPLAGITNRCHMLNGCSNCRVTIRILVRISCYGLYSRVEGSRMTRSWTSRWSIMSD